ncbi:MAG: DUF2865 domain-containing protein [Phyllobacteriaceae bacterium]|nr:DUF2865 domain-containing protein [Phyllobacteriaceae bacterium]
MVRADRSTILQRIATATVASATLTLAFAAVGPARAQSAADQWATAIREQREAIATNRSSRSRCGVAGDPRCAALTDRGRLMEENLARLERQHARMTGAPRPAAPTRTTRGRDEAPPGVGARPVEPAHPQRSLFSMLFGGGDASETRQTTVAVGSGAGETRRSAVRIDGVPVEGDIRAGADAGETPAGPSEGDWGAHSGNYRTLCVRTCDGYFFPVSFDASRARLATDANVCRALCPEAETRLYFHDASGQEAENAVAADDGSPLAKMPNAFLYRTKRIDGCTCGRPDPRRLPMKAGGLAGGAPMAANDAGDVPLPRVRPSPDEDPATQAVELSGLSTEPVAPLTPMSAESAARLAARVEPMRDRTTPVRIVGPKWLSDRATEAAASSPVRDPAR